MHVTKISTVTLQKDKLTKIVPYEEEILDFFK